MYSVVIYAFVWLTSWMIIGVMSDHQLQTKNTVLG